VKNNNQHPKNNDPVSVKSENIEEVETKEEFIEKVERATSQVSKRTSE
jgi:hypothetical protein